MPGESTWWDRHRESIEAVLDRHDADASRSRPLLDRIVSEFPVPGGDTEALRHAPVWPTYQDAVAWSIAAAVAPESERSVDLLLDAPDLRETIKHLAVADYLCGSRTPFVRRFDLARHLRNMATFLDRERKMLDSFWPPAPAYRDFLWGWDYVRGAAIWKTTTHFIQVEEDDRSIVFFIPWLETEEPVQSDCLGPYGLQVIGQPAEYQVLPWYAIRPALQPRDPAASDEDEEYPHLRSTWESKAKKSRWVGREHVELRIDLLRKLATFAGEPGDPEKLWAEVERRLVVDFKQEHPEGRLAEGELVLQRDHPRSPVSFDELTFGGGPVTALFELIGHVELEIRVGQHDRTVQALGAARPEHGGVFAAVGWDSGCPLGRAVEAYLEREPDADEFWRGYRARLARSLDLEFYRLVERTPRLVRGRHREEFLSRDGHEADRILHEIEWPKQVRPDEFVFARVPGKWVVRFRGERTEIDGDPKGMRRLQFIMQAGRECTAQEVIDATEGSTSTASAPVRGELGDEVGIETRDDLGGDDVPDLPPRALALLDERRQVQEQLATEELDESARGRLEAKCEKLAAEAERLIRRGEGGSDASTTGEPRRRRRETPAEANARVKLRDTITTAYDKLEGEAPKLVAHLRGSIRRGGAPAYQPPDPVPWIFELPDSAADPADS